MVGYSEARNLGSQSTDPPPRGASAQPENPRSSDHAVGEPVLKGINFPDGSAISTGPSGGLPVSTSVAKDSARSTRAGNGLSYRRCQLVSASFVPTLCDDAEHRSIQIGSKGSKDKDFGSVNSI